MAKETFSLTEFDIFFLSFDEPNAEKHWADLLEKAPWAKRVHGVVGFDACHRECANQSETPWFITVDADNIVNPKFFDQTVTFDPVVDARRCYSWNGLNMINGLMYGNGGLKLWSKEFASNMKSHELSEDDQAVDFCWEADYQQVFECFSEVWSNGSPYQAFRSGYREGVKLALDRGQRVEPHMMKTRLHNVNLRNLRIWSSVGSDVNNGLWAILGTRMGWAAVCDPKWDMSVIRDYKWFKEYWDTEIKAITYDKVVGSRTPESDVLVHVEQESAKLGAWLKSQTKIAVPQLDNDASQFFRDTFKFRND